MFTWHTAGESHGRALVALADGVPAGVAISSGDLRNALARRRLGHGRGARMKFEQDEIVIIGGVRHGRTIGAPVAVTIGNSEWPRWEDVMSPDPVEGWEPTASGRGAPLTRPRPGHADLAGMVKFGHDDVRPVLERASARETAARVVIGTLAEAILHQVAGVRLVSHVVAVGSVGLPDDAARPGPGDTDALDASHVRCIDPETDAAFVAEIDAARGDADTLGGVVEVIAYGVPVGLGTYTRAQDRLDARLAGAVMSIQAVKGVEIGDGFTTATRRGSAAHDEILPGGRATNRAGGIEGGMSNGLPVVVRAALKPISSIPRALRTVDSRTGEPATAINQRSDTCAVAPAAVVAQAMVAIELAAALLEKTGGDSVAEARRNLLAYLAAVDEHLAPAIDPGGGGANQ
ncbi:MAG TPA: chorismate synthase [Actinomycetaceae bacterium]|nr:chorismate synthase [Actinomycetaceae bacterium]